MDKQAIECIVNAPKKDKLIANLQKQKSNLEKSAVNDSIMLGDNMITMSKQSNQIFKLTEKVNRGNGTKKIYGGVGFVIGVVGTIFILK